MGGFGSGFSGGRRTGGLKVVSGSNGQVLRFHNGTKSVIGTSDLTYTNADGFSVSGNIQHSGNISPENDGVHALGGSGKTYSSLNIQNVHAANVYTGDFHMRNEHQNRVFSAKIADFQ